MSPLEAHNSPRTTSRRSFAGDRLASVSTAASTSSSTGRRSIFGGIGLTIFSAMKPKTERDNSGSGTGTGSLQDVDSDDSSYSTTDIHDGAAAASSGMNGSTKNLQVGRSLFGYSSSVDQADDDNNDEHNSANNNSRNGGLSSSQTTNSAGVHSENSSSGSSYTDPHNRHNAESKHVGWLRSIMFLTLVVAAALVGFAMFWSLRRSQKEQFEIHFEDHSTTIIDAFTTHWKSSMAALDGMAIQILSHAKSANSTWPMVVMPDFEVRAAAARRLGLFTTLSFVPFVPDDDARAKFEQFCIQNTEWVARGRQFESATDQDSWKFGNFHKEEGDDAEAETAGNSAGITATATAAATPGDNRALSSAQKARASHSPHSWRHLVGLVSESQFPHQDQKVRGSYSGLTSRGILQVPDTFSNHDSDAKHKEFAASRKLDNNRNEPIKIVDGIADGIWELDLENGGGKYAPYTGGPYLPIWQHSRVDAFTNYNLMSDPSVGKTTLLAIENQEMIVSDTIFLADVIDSETGKNAADSPASAIRYPLVQRVEQAKSANADGTAAEAVYEAVGVLSATMYWDSYMQVGQLPETAEGIDVVLKNACDQSFTFTVIDGDILFQAKGDLHSQDFDDFEEVFVLEDIFQEGSYNDSPGDYNFGRFEVPFIGFSSVNFSDNYCKYSLHIYPSHQMRQRYVTDEDPFLYTGLVVAVVIFTSFMFVGYDWFVERRQRVVVNSAAKSHAIVSSLFPRNVRKRLFEDINGEKDAKNRPSRASDGQAAGNGGQSHAILTTQKAKLRNLLSTNRESTKSTVQDDSPSSSTTGQGSHGGIQSKPIADLFPNTTVLFADIAGFTAWSSTREPSQVFTLLESIYGAFDAIADRRKVFKVETIGDCYMAVTGLPDIQPDHALIMAKFACAALQRMATITGKLAVELGPDTTELAMRIGLHSGPVTAGVLRGQKSRFQLFGDTVNTASRMESTGLPNHIQCTQETADLLTHHGKPHWITPRKDQIHAKGKGTIQTFWVASKRVGALAASGPSQEFVKPPTSRPALQLSGFVPGRDEQDASPSVLNFQRMVNWNVDLLSRLLKRVVVRQISIKEQQRKSYIATALMPDLKHRGSASSKATDQGAAKAKHPREEYAEFIKMPRFDATSAMPPLDPDSIDLGPKVHQQLKDYITQIACSYRQNPFHNYDHASHVTMSANKILMRVVSAEGCETRPSTVNQAAATLHDYTFGITSDPLTHFACVFAALIHDVDHPGVSNGQLIKENDPLAAKYNKKSVAEQNSLDLAWGLFMTKDFADLRNCMFHTQEDQHRFRQLLVNSLLATDIFDPELKALRNKRWEKAFANGTRSDSSESVDLKATIVIEHILQAADVSHTMQHWHVYQKWNRRLFFEMYTSYQMGRLQGDPSVSWYKGELWFFDNYVIPLAEKLKECGVFGVSSDEFLNYARMNRSEWAQKGERIVAAMKREFDGEDDKE